ncbi:hypothetical protein [Virgibacillus sp. DJP39]|uniref:hypothetical protein n=1 Tax=Virgibacillus sp. DJP39 TaxID=3409790 RepID=UPI003BB6DEBE
MNFRKLYLTGFIIIGIALIFPMDVFAQKSEKAKNPNALNDHVNQGVKDLQNKSSNAKVKVPVPAQAHEKADKVIPQQVKEKAKKAVELPSQANEEAREKAQVVRKGIEKVSEDSETTKKKNKKVVNKNKKKQKPKEGSDDNYSSNAQVEKNSTKSVPHDSPRKEGNQQATNHAKDVNSVPSVKETDYIKEKPDTEENKQIPFSKEKVPKDSIAVTQHSTKVPVGPSKDRSGQNTTSFIDKSSLEAWKHSNLKRIQPFISHLREYRNQWVNAPPFQPPQVTPFF